MIWLGLIGAGLVLLLALLAWLGPERVPAWAQPAAAAVAALMALFVLSRGLQPSEGADLSHGHPLEPNTNDLEEAAVAPSLDRIEAIAAATEGALDDPSPERRVDELAALVDRTGSP